MSISVQDQPALLILGSCWRNRRAGPLDESGISSSACGCVCVYAYRMYPVSEVCVCVLVGSHLLLSLLFSDPTPGTEHQHSLGSRCPGRSTGTGHELPSSLFLYLSLPAVPNQLLCPPAPGCRCACGVVARGRHHLVLVPSQTSQNTSYHLIRFLLGPLRPTRVFDDWQYCYALAARISPLGPASFLLFLSPFFPRKTKPPTEPTDRRPREPGPDLTCGTMV